MQFDPTLTEAEVLSTLRKEAEAIYGAERVRDLEATLADAARALWQVSQVRIDLFGTEPDFND